jgi:hypothetical protein
MVIPRQAITGIAACLMMSKAFSTIAKRGTKIMAKSQRSRKMITLPLVFIKDRIHHENPALAAPSDFIPRLP